jgi:hypothetical protein
MTEADGTNMNKTNKIYQGTIPARQTLEFIDAQTKFNNHIEITMNDLKNDISNLVGTIKNNDELNKSQHCEILKRLGRMEKFGLAILIILALVTLGYILINAGLPKP